MRGSDSSRCSVAAAGRLLTHATIARARRRRAGRAGAPALAVANGHPARRPRIASRSRGSLARRRSSTSATTSSPAASARRSPAEPSRCSSARSRLPWRLRRSSIRNSRAHSSGDSARGSPRATRAERTLRSARRRRARRRGRATPTGTGDRRRRAAGALERVAVGARPPRWPRPPRWRAGRRTRRSAVHGRVRAPRLRRALARGDLPRPRREAAGSMSSPRRRRRRRRCAASSLTGAHRPRGGRARCGRPAAATTGFLAAAGAIRVAPHQRRVVLAQDFHHYRRAWLRTRPARSAASSSVQRRTRPRPGWSSPRTRAADAGAGRRPCRELPRTRTRPGIALLGRFERGLSARRGDSHSVTPEPVS